MWWRKQQLPAFMWNTSHYPCGILKQPQILYYSCHWEMKLNSATLVIWFTQRMWQKWCSGTSEISHKKPSAWAFWYHLLLGCFFWNLATCCEKPKPHGDTKCQLSAGLPATCQNQLPGIQPRLQSIKQRYHIVWDPFLPICSRPLCDPSWCCIVQSSALHSTLSWIPNPQEYEPNKIVVCSYYI